MFASIQMWVMIADAPLVGSFSEAIWGSHLAPLMRTFLCPDIKNPTRAPRPRDTSELLLSYFWEEVIVECAAVQTPVGRAKVTGSVTSCQSPQVPRGACGCLLIQVDTKSPGIRFRFWQILTIPRFPIPIGSSQWYIMLIRLPIQILDYQTSNP